VEAEPCSGAPIMLETAKKEGEADVESIVFKFPEFFFFQFVPGVPCRENLEKKLLLFLLFLAYRNRSTL